MSLAEAATAAVRTDLEVERLLGVRHGIRVELLVAPETSRAVLIVSPTVDGVSILMQGGLGDVAEMERTGSAVLVALAGVVPLVSGEAFRGGRGIVGRPVPDLRQ